MITNSELHYQIIRGIIENGFAPTVDDLANKFKSDKEEVIEQLYKLQEYHGVVLHPDQPKVWVIYPFSLAPTNFYVKSMKGEWWGNCAWCSLGVAALLNDDVNITTTIGAETKQVEITLVNGEIQQKNLFIHFPIPMKNAWENVIYTAVTCWFLKMKSKWTDGQRDTTFQRATFNPLRKSGSFQKNGMEIT